MLFHELNRFGINLAVMLASGDFNPLIRRKGKANIIIISIPRITIMLIRIQFCNTMSMGRKRNENSILCPNIF